MFGFFLCCFATNLSLKQKSELGREIISHFPSIDNNHSTSIPLRRFAGESNSANTNILPGESLIIQLGNDGNNKSFQIANGKTWYLAKSTDGKRKGGSERTNLDGLLIQIHRFISGCPNQINFFISIFSIDTKSA
jgi:hypothetical protein